MYEYYSLRIRLPFLIILIPSPGHRFKKLNPPALPAKTNAKVTKHGYPKARKFPTRRFRNRQIRLKSNRRCLVPRVLAWHSDQHWVHRVFVWEVPREEVAYVYIFDALWGEDGFCEELGDKVYYEEIGGTIVHFNLRQEQQSKKIKHQL